MGLDGYNYLIAQKDKFITQLPHHEGQYGKCFEFAELEQFVEFVRRPAPVTIKLNNEYTATIDGDFVTVRKVDSEEWGVGCQRFHIDKLKEILAAHQKLVS